MSSVYWRAPEDAQQELAASGVSRPSHRLMALTGEEVRASLTRFVVRRRR